MNFNLQDEHSQLHRGLKDTSAFWLSGKQLLSLMSAKWSNRVFIFFLIRSSYMHESV